jgi:hypothetical protein
MASENLVNGPGAFDSLKMPSPKEKQPPTKALPSSDLDAELDWVVVQIIVGETGGLTALQEVRGWWVGNSYVPVTEDRGRRTRVVTMTDNGEVVDYDSSKYK